MTQLAGRPTPAPTPSTHPSPLRLPQSTALVMGSIIGVGIFSLPYAIASYGPDQPGRHGAGDRSAPLRWRSCSPCCRGAYRPRAGPTPTRAQPSATGSGSARRGSTGSPPGPATPRSPSGGSSTWRSSSTRAAAQQGRSSSPWSACGSLLAVNLTGVRNMGVFQLWSTVLKFVPLALMATIGLFFVEAGNFTPWNTSGDTSLSAIGGAMAICLFSYLGVETAAVAAGKVRDPERNVPKSTIYGTLGECRGLPALAGRGLRHPARRRAGPGRQPGRLLSGRRLDRRRLLAGVHRGRRRRRLRHRRPERLDHDLRGDAAGRSQGRTLPPGLRITVHEGRPGVRHHLLHRAGIGCRPDQLPGGPVAPQFSPRSC